MAKKSGKPKWEVEEVDHSEIKKKISEKFESGLRGAFKEIDKKKRSTAISDIENQCKEMFAENEDVTENQVMNQLKSLEKDIVRTAILKEKKNFIGTGIDICKKSLQISKVNGQKLRLSNRFRLFKSNIDNFNTGKYDLIVSNPPYIKKIDLKCLEKDIGFEPKQALVGGLDGLSEIRKVINKSSELIKRNGHLIIEIGFDQKNKVKKILRDKGFYIKKTVKDLSNHDRCIVSIKT